MKGLLLKDFINLKKQLKLILIILVFYTILAISSKNAFMVNGMLTLILGFMPMTSMSYDERADWDKYALAMPVSRTDIVLSKYIQGLFFIVISLILNIILNIYIGPNTFENTIIIPLTFASIVTLFLAILFPILFKYGVEKSRIIMYIIFLVPFAAAFIIYKLNIQMPDERTIEILLKAFPFAALALYVVSIAISFTIYNKKEL